MTTGTPTVLAQRVASEEETSRPSGAMVTRWECAAPRDVDTEPGCPPLMVLELSVVVMVERDVVLGTGRKVAVVLVEPTLLGVRGGMLVSTRASEARSSLFPTRRTLSLGEARARASFRKGWMARKEAWDVMS